MSSSVSALQGSPDPAGDGVIDPAARPVRRSFTAEYRARVVAGYEAAQRGQKGAVLRREGLYQSQIREWTAAREALASGPVVSRRPHRAAGERSEPDRLRAENRRLTRELARSQAVAEIMGKLQGLLEAISESPGTQPPPATR